MFSKLKHLWPYKTVDKFQNIEGYDDVKEIISRALDTDENYNLLLCGPPASSKTLFQKNRFIIQDAKTVLWTLLTAIYEDELMEEPHHPILPSV
jgi:hypothetical protein